MHHQPVVDLSQGSVVGVEALVRCQHPVLRAELATTPSGVTVSIGMAPLRAGESSGELAVRADGELYRGRLGRASVQ